ncbi:SDR family NAD(P)-dependent oxidoreductase [Pseudoroseomonas ludipueritiae]|uniref:SDR family oxidoreductase n=1 Tax=Pseudoroseomonas ludipueritiae TaxID=198093 RepID=A0ABR7R1V5_9PROT|nr:SDR family oxidoreductase [Pseudoroseomonas ludipueritiae]MBC9175647.1 SDR family oxidoreductase [Pseudoroseomonas ludipueritiae]
MDLELEGKVAVITGGTRGIGLAAARLLAREGADVALVSRHADEAARVADDIARMTGRRTLGLAADTTDDAAVAIMAVAVEREMGGAHILVNCAAEPAGQKAVPAPSEAEWASLASHMDTKVMGYLRCARALLPLMRRAGWGRIINVSGLGARRTGDVVGAIRNVAVVALAKNLADELAGTGIAVTTVHPGLTRTEKVDAMLKSRAQVEGRSLGEVEASLAANVLMGRLPTAEDVAQVIAFLASPRSVTVNGVAIDVGGGLRGAINY